MTGDTYEISFNNQVLYFDVDGEWKFANSDSTIPNGLQKKTDISASTVYGAAVISDNVGTYDLFFSLTFVASADGEWADGFKLTFPSEVEILSASISGGGWGDAGGGSDAGQNCLNFPDGLIDVAANSIMWGDSSRSGFGCIENDVVFVVNISPVALPITVDWEAYDDAFGSASIDASGAVTLTEIRYEFKREIHWKLLNVTTSEILLQSQRFPEDIYSNDIPTTEGFKVVLADFTFNFPTTYFATEFTVDADPSDGDLILWGGGFSFTDLWYIFGSGTPIPTVEQAQPDLEFRFTGVAADNESPVTAGGQFSTQWPSTPAFGNPDLSGVPNVQLSVPFELWNLEANDGAGMQIEVAVMNRNADGNGAPNTTAPGIWRMAGRDYMVILQKEYTDDPAPIRSLNDPTATWLLFWRQGGESVWSTGDEFIVRFANPLQVDLDLFRFQVPTELEAIGIPVTFELAQNFPNPFNAETTIQYSLPRQSDVKLLIYNLLGQEVFRFEVRDQKLGKYQIRWNGKNERGNDLSSGLYIYRFFAGNSVQTKKMILLK